jgi:hypothetical protein
LDFHAQILGQPVPQINIVALELAVLIHITKRRLVAKDADDHLAALLDGIDAAESRLGRCRLARILFGGTAAATAEELPHY